MFLILEGENLGPGLALPALMAVAHAVPFGLLAGLSTVLSRSGGWAILPLALLALGYGDWLTHRDLDTDPVAGVGFLLVPMAVTGAVLIAAALDALVRFTARFTGLSRRPGGGDGLRD
ncbi:MAG: hypothetical protein ACR2LY_09600 [Thermoleophilaceae bacterium]